MATRRTRQLTSSKRQPTAATEAPPPGAKPGYLPPLLRRAWYGLNQGFRRRLVAQGLTPDQYTVLRNLMETGDGGLTQRELNDRVTSDPNTIAALVKRMDRAGWVNRAADTADGRAKRVQISSAGRRKFRDAQTIATTLHAEVAAAIPPDEWEPFLAQLACLANACQQALARSNRA